MNLRFMRLSSIYLHQSRGYMDEVARILEHAMRFSEVVIPGGIRLPNLEVLAVFLGKGIVLDPPDAVRL